MTEIDGPPCPLEDAIQRLEDAAEVVEYMHENEEDEWSTRAVGLKGLVLDLTLRARELREQRSEESDT